MREQFKYIFIISFFSISCVYSQEEENNNIGTEVVNVVKPYTPSISDAYKVKETPSLNDSLTTSKKEINYSIFSVPVASTFTPARGKATGVPKSKKEKLYNSYVSLGGGNYGNVLLDFYTNRSLGKDQNLDINLNHHSSQGGIDSVFLDDKFYNTKLEAAYTMKDRYMSWGIRGGVEHQIYNWYGVPEGFDFVANSQLDVKQNYYTAFAGANLDVDSYLFKGGDVLLRRFWDRFNSAEHRALVKPKVEFPVGEEAVKVDFRVDYISGDFKRAYSSNTALKYQNVILGGSPSFVLLSDELTLNLGASVYYKLDIEDGNGNGVFIYPNINASYRLVEDYAIVYGGIEGDLVQNSYFDFQNDNQFISPTIPVTPTNKQFDAYGGVKGRFLPNVGYNLRASYTSEVEKPFFQNNLIPYGFESEEGYQYGNSFGIVYDDVTTVSLFGEVKVDINKAFSLSANATLFDYSTDDEAEAWNMPSITASLDADLNIDDKFFAGANLFFIGERKDLLGFNDINNPSFPDLLNPTQVVTLDSYFDANAHIGYHFTDKLSAYVKANNMTNNQYTRWSNYPVQGFQILGGLTYKFDF